jgi:hypothetical protein
MTPNQISTGHQTKSAHKLTTPNQFSVKN